jgi:hypothetical protein
MVKNIRENLRILTNGMMNTTNLDNFPTYRRKLNSWERTRKAGIGWAMSNADPEAFDESFNHVACDKLGIPRETDQPVDFDI